MKKVVAMMLVLVLLAATLVAVSYTHLDVYKRQVLFDLNSCTR